MKLNPFAGKLNYKLLAVYLALFLGAAALGVAMLLHIYGDKLLNDYIKGKVERALAGAHEGYSLELGGLTYSFGANRMDARTIILNTSELTLTIDRISLSGVRWLRLIWGNIALSDLMSNANIDATGLNIKFPKTRYKILCDHIYASAPDAELFAKGIELSPFIKDEEIFSKPFRTTRFSVLVPTVTVTGLNYKGLLKGKSFKAKSVTLTTPSFDAFVNRDKTVEPFVKSPLMVHEALSTINRPLRIDSLGVTDGSIKYSERVAAGAKPGIITFTAVNMDIKGITNRGAPKAAIKVSAQGKLMNAGLLKVVMAIPVKPKDFSMSYYGSLEAMDLTRLNAFLVIAEHTRVKSGTVQELTYKIDVNSGTASGNVIAVYKDFSIGVLDIKSGSEHSISSFLANAFKIWSTSDRLASGILKPGEVKYTKLRDEGFMQFVWYALRSGVLDTINR
ncbi:MAG: hypothetical protein A2204_05460 [Elusimicrobia bacterium RIFOXYA1_FULL_47_7]|nr:MAG: hypothetical protein A2204_05460 [Elusimicrobia bacterium RIFOXYA1_FULL_47_7]